MEPIHLSPEEPIVSSERLSLGVPVLCNDLLVAVDVNVGQDWHVLYPRQSLERSAFLDKTVVVRLRDDHAIKGQCQVEGKPLPLKLSADFDTFCEDASCFIKGEIRAICREDDRRRVRKEATQKLYRDLIRRKQMSRKRCVCVCFFFLSRSRCCFSCCAPWTTVQPENALASVLLSLAVAVLLGIYLRGELRSWIRYEEAHEAETCAIRRGKIGVCGCGGSCSCSCDACLGRWLSCLLLLLCGGCFVLFCIVTMSVLHYNNGFWWTPWILSASCIVCAC